MADSVTVNSVGSEQGVKAEAKLAHAIELNGNTAAAIVDRISRGFGALSLGAAVQIISQITVVPVALYAWGKIRYGEWIVLTGLVTFLRLTDLGLQSFVVNKLCASYARGARDEMQRILHSALRIHLPLVLVMAPICAAVLFSFSLDLALGLQTISRNTFGVVGTILAIELLIGVPMGVVAGIYRATGRLARGGVIGACQQFAMAAVTISLIFFHAGFVGIAATRVGIVLIIGGWILRDLRRLYPWLHLWPKSGSWREGASMIGPGLFFMIIPVADYLSTQFTLILVQGSLDGGEVSRLATHRTVVNLAMMASGLLTNAMWPEITALHARSQASQLIKTHRSLVRMNLWLVGAVTFVMLPFIPLIYPSWTAGKLAVDSWTIGFLITRMLLWSVWGASMVVLCAINRQKSVACSVMIGAALTGAISIWLVPVIGISGAALAQLLGDLAISVWLIPLKACRETSDSFVRFLSETCLTLLKGLLIPVGIGLLGWRLIHSEVMRLAVLVPSVSCLALALMWNQLASYERSHLVRLVRRLG